MSRLSSLARGGAVAALCAVLLSACASRPEVPDGVRFVSGGKLDRKVAVDKVNIGLTPTGTSRAWTTIENRSGASLQLMARAVFLGENRQLIEAEPGWSRLFLEAKGSVVFEGTSMSTAAKEVIIEIKAAD